MPRTHSPGTHGRRARSDSDSVAVPLPPQTLAAAARPSPPATPRCCPLYRRMSAARGGTTTSRPPIEQWRAVSPNCCWAPRRLSLGGSLLLPRSLRGCAPAPPRGTWSLPSTCCPGYWPRRIGLWGWCPSSEASVLCTRTVILARSAHHKSMIQPLPRAQPAPALQLLCLTCPCDFETPTWVFRYPGTAPAIGSSDGDRSGGAPPHSRV